MLPFLSPLQRLASAEHLSDTNDSEQDEQAIRQPPKKRALSQENLWPYLPSDRLPMMWGSPPRAMKERRVKQKSQEGRTRASKNIVGVKSNTVTNNEGNRSDAEHLLMLKKKHGKNNCNDDDEDEDEEEEEEDEDDDEDDDEEDDEIDDDKWPSSDCWEVKYSPTLTSSPGESNVLRVHRIRSDIDYVERDHSPCSEIISDSKERLFNNNSTNTNYNSKNVKQQVKDLTRSSTDTHSTNSDLRNHNISTTFASVESNHTAVNHDTSQNLLMHEDEEDDWNFSTHFHNEVNKERERLEAQILKDGVDHQQEETLQGEALCTNSDCNIFSHKPQHTRSYSYCSPSQYHHKKLHHAKRRHTFDTEQKITVTDVDCNRIKVTFLESTSESGFFKPSTMTRTG